MYEPILFSPTLQMAADVLDDLERSRIANQNRLRSLTATEPDADGELRALGLNKSHPSVGRLDAIVEGLARIEADATKNLEKEMWTHPLGPWVHQQKGVGNKQFARLLAAIGDPYINMNTGVPRTVGQLWQFCGHGAPGKRKKGMTQADLFALGSPNAKKRLWLIEGSIVKTKGRWRDVYDDRKAATEGKLHTADCVRCGPSGKPAQVGTTWNPGHRHADAMRFTGKKLLLDLWLESKRLHEEHIGAEITAA